MRAAGRRFALGFGLERDQLTGVILDFAGNVRWQAFAASRPVSPAEATLRRLEADVAVLGPPEWASRPDRLCGVGIAAPGPIDRTAGTIVGPPNFPAAARRLRPGAEPGPRLPDRRGQRRDRRRLGTRWHLRRGVQTPSSTATGARDRGRPGDRRRGLPGMTGNAMEIGHVVVNTGGRRATAAARLPGGGGVARPHPGSAARYAIFSSVRRDRRRNRGFADAGRDPRPWRPEKLARPCSPWSTSSTSTRSSWAANISRAVEQSSCPSSATRSQPSLPPLRSRATKVTVSTLGEAANAIGAAELSWFRSLLGFPAPSGGACSDPRTRGGPGRAAPGERHGLPKPIFRRGQEREQFKD